jgi:hypothetical protein
MDKWEGYLDALGLVRAYKGREDGNAILWSAYAHYVGALKYTPSQMIQFYGEHALPDGRFRYSWRNPLWERYASHDNMTALTYFASKTNLLNTFAQRADISIYLHPRDRSYLGILLGRKRILHKILTPLYYLVYSLIVLHTCNRDYLSKNGIRDTDGKLLYLLRREVLPLGFVDKLCTKLLIKRWGQDYVGELLKTLWWHDQGHPILEQFNVRLPLQ